MSNDVIVLSWISLSRNDSHLTWVVGIHHVSMYNIEKLVAMGTRLQCYHNNYLAPILFSSNFAIVFNIHRLSMV